MGIETGSSGQQCIDGLGLGRPYDTAFSECCNDALPKSSTTSTSTTTTTTISSPTSIQSDTAQSPSKTRELNTSDPRKREIYIRNVQTG